MTLPKVASQEEWQIARDALLVKEKAHTRAKDELNAERRRLPMMKIEKEYVFEGSDGKASLLDLFDGRRQLIVYHFMMAAGSDHRCPGCSLTADNIGHLAHLHARDTTMIIMAPAELAQIEAYKQRMGWTTPWFSAYGNDFTEDVGVLDGGAGINVFLRDGDDVYRTYFTTARGCEQIVGTLHLLDLTPFGRQEAWEQPGGRGSDEPSAWWRLHDEY
jgi:predicted dithiol-disulfide oxidoreductase (DUF899 family)